MSHDTPLRLTARTETYCSHWLCAAHSSPTQEDLPCRADTPLRLTARTETYSSNRLSLGLTPCEDMAGDLGILW